MTDDELFLTAILRCSRSRLYTEPVLLTPEQEKTLNVMRQRRLQGEPVQYIVGFTEFMGYHVDVGPGVLVPRPETEVLVESFIRELGPDRGRECVILDIGTGSGCIAVALLKALPLCRVVAVDISASSLDFARRNAEANRVADRITFIERDIFWFMDETAQRFDAVVSNPPYIPSTMLSELPADVRCEPKVALDGGPDGLHFYRFIIPSARKILKKKGLLALEFGDGQGKELENIFRATGPWDKIKNYKDNAGKDRVVVAQNQSG
jgi:release factor glutamine methyltransferase